MKKQESPGFSRGEQVKFDMDNQPGIRKAPISRAEFMRLAEVLGPRGWRKERRRAEKEAYVRRLEQELLNE